jgi:DNA-binding transcriptional ArsR family regulator
MARIGTGNLELANIFKVLANVDRVTLVAALGEGDRSFRDLAASLGKPPAVVARHLGVLCRAGLATYRDSRGSTLYRLRHRALLKALNRIARIAR